jgi:isoleucyl-tRNA synthetase
MAESTKINYKKTLNLPATSFPMRAALSANEPKSLDRWQQGDLYERVTADRRDAVPFAFHDGPPYANGLIHVGHLLNKVLKDFVVRSRLMEGKLCRYVPGWDCHGLPIEHKVLTELKASGELEKLHALGEDERREAIRLKCAAYARKYVELQADQMKRLMTLADYKNPYLTLVPEYERAVLEVFAGLVEQGLVYRALKSVHWSVENQTALAEAELEYHDRTDTSVYVDFEAADRDAVARVFGVELDQTPSFMIWTTTPWTLPANLAIAVHERFRYSLVRVDGNITVIASELVETVTDAAGSTSVEVLGECHGADLVGLTYRHPLDHPTYGVCGIVKADYVTLEDGTGLVHTAPGHGEEDNLTAIKEGFDIYCPVLADGTYDDTVPQWLVGMSIWDANDKVVARLRADGNLYYAHSFEHSYPHDWRSKTPVIFRATEQWFIGVDRPTAHGGRSLREMAREECESGVRFVPEWGRNRMRGMIETRPDWCLSRQRAWGLPIPAFQTPDGDVLLTTASTRSIAEAFGERGSDAWFTETPPQLLAAYDLDADPDASPAVKAAGVSSLRKMYDIFDVWFESGTSWHAVMRRLDLGYPVDLYLEGSDQHRGWFQLSMLPALGMTGKSPFRAVLTHGFTVAKDGRKMSKSLGNTIDVEDLLGSHGADVCRWWVSSLAFENDVKMDMSFFDVAGETYRKVRNTLRFLLGNVGGTESRTAPAADLADPDPTSIHACVLGQAAAMQQQVRAAYETYAFRKAHQLLYDFCNDTLSAFYCAAVKDRLYCDKPDSPRRLTTRRVMHSLLEMLCRLLGPILPHTADEAYRALWSAGETDERSVHLLTFADLPEVKADFDWPKLMQVRESVLKALEDAKQRGIDNPLDAGVVLPAAETWLEKFEPDLPDLFGVSRVRRTGESAAVEIDDLRGEPRCDRCWMRLETCTGRSDGGTLCDRCADAVGV